MRARVRCRGYKKEMTKRKRESEKLCKREEKEEARSIYMRG